MRPLLLASLAAGLALPAPGALIDDFSTPQGPLLNAAGAVSGAGIIGGVRESLGGAFFQAVNGFGVFATPDGTNNLFFLAYDGKPDLAFCCGGFTPVDLTDAGVSNLLLIAVSDFTTSGQNPPTATIGLNLIDADGNGYQFPSIFVTGAPGIYSAPLPSSGIDLTRIIYIGFPVTLEAQPARLLGDAPRLDLVSLTVDYICTGASNTCLPAQTTVPEPTSLALFALGLAVLATQKRRRSLNRRP